MEELQLRGVCRELLREPRDALDGAAEGKVQAGSAGCQAALDFLQSLQIESACKGSSLSIQWSVRVYFSGLPIQMEVAQQGSA